MGRPFGVPVYVAPSWFLVAALITWVFGGQLDRVLPELGGARYLVSLFFAVAFYASVLVHELAHTVAALRFKLPVRRIQLQFFGGVSEIEKESETPGREFVLAFVGPLLSLVLAGLFYLGMQAVEPGTVPGVLLAGLMISNLIVAAFNLLPGLPLDGGRMLRAVVWKITGKPMTGTVAAAWVGRALAVAVLIGLPLLTHTGALGNATEDIGGMETVTDALLAAILAAIIWTGAGNSLRMARLREHLPELRARTLTRRAVPVESDTPLSEALRRANEAGARALVVVDGHGDPDGPGPRGRHRRRPRTPPPLGRRQRPRPGPHRRHEGLRRTGRRGAPGQPPGHPRHRVPGGRGDRRDLRRPLHRRRRARLRRRHGPAPSA